MYHEATTNNEARSLCWLLLHKYALFDLAHQRAQNLPSRSYLPPSLTPHTHNVTRSYLNDIYLLTSRNVRACNACASKVQGEQVESKKKKNTISLEHGTRPSCGSGARGM